MFANVHPQNLIDLGLLLLRFSIAAIFIVHGLQKKGMWKMQPSEQLKKPMLNVMRLLSVCEPLGGLAMIGGFLTRWAGLGFAIIMLGAINLKARTFKKPFSATPDVGWEFEFLLLFVALALVFMGAGGLSIDALLGIR